MTTHPPSDQLRLDVCRRELAVLGAHLASVDADGWRAPSACVGWTVHDVVAHLVWIVHRALAHVRHGLAGPDSGDAPPADASSDSFRVMTNRVIAAAAQSMPTSGEPLVKELVEMTSEFVDLFDGLPPDVWRTPYAYRSGDAGGVGRTTVPVSFFLDYRCLETAVHSWDIRWGGARTLAFADDTAECVLDVLLWSLVRRPFPIESEATACVEFRLNRGGPIRLAPGPNGTTRVDASDASPLVSVECSAGGFVLLSLGRIRLADEIAHGRVAVDGDTSVLSSIDAVYFSDLMLGDLVQRMRAG
jgi:uncharacterized protein (TIGR03083 family)